MKVIYNPIGIIHSPFNRLEDMPIQPASFASGPGILEIYPEFVEGLKDLDGFSHIYLIYHFHKVRQPMLTVSPFLDNMQHGIFATRAPVRPNPIGLSLVKIIRIENNLIHIDRVDVLNQTPLLDLKPYIPEFEVTEDVQIGWLEQAKGQVRTQKSGSRFGLANHHKLIEEKKKEKKTK